MPRPGLEIGTYGDIGTRERADGTWRAWASYRDVDGETRPVDGYGPTENKAKADLRKKLVRRQEQARPSQGAMLTPDSRFGKAIDMYIEELKLDESMADQSIAAYLREIEQSDDARADPDTIKIRPALGNYRIRELDVGRFDEYLKRIVAQGFKPKARYQKMILKEICELCIRLKAMPGPNPLAAMSKRAMKSKAPKPKAAAWEQLQALRAQVEAWGRGEPIPGSPGYRTGPRRNARLLLDVMDVAAATGARPHEVLAIRWEDISPGPPDAEGKPQVRLTICGTLVQLKGQGVLRQERTKTDASFRSLLLPDWAVQVLRERWVAAGEPESGLVFPSRAGGAVNPCNFNRSWRSARGEEFKWVTLRTYRKTVATALNDALGVAAAGAQLGHAPGSKVTARSYIERAIEVGDNRNVLAAYRGSDQAVLP